MTRTRELVDSPRFLIVEDDDTTADFLRDILKSGFPKAKVEIAYSNDQANEILKTFSPDLITSDIARPGGSGLDFMAALRKTQHVRIRKVPVIAITGLANPRIQRQEIELTLYRAGFRKVFPKPFSVEQLLDYVNELLPLEIDPDLALLHLKRESRSLDYKGFVDLSNKDGVASLAKDVIAMANSGGGNIIIGMAEKSPGVFVGVGIDPQFLDYLEVSMLNRALRSYLDPPIAVDVRRVSDDGKTFVILKVPSADDVPILAARNNDKASLYMGRLYVRNTACESAEAKSSSELRLLLSRFVGERREG